MHSIDQLTDILGYSKDQVRDRLGLLRPWFDKYIRRGKKNKILVTSDGLGILRRVKEFDDNGVSLKEIPTKVKAELNENKESPDSKERESDTKVSPNHTQTDLIREKDQRIKELQEQVNYLRTQANQKNQLLKEKSKLLKEKDEQINRLIPGETEEPGENGEDDFKKLTLWGVVKKWFTTTT